MRTSLKGSLRLLISFLIIFTLFPITSYSQYWKSKYGHLDNYYLIKDSTEAFFEADTSRINDRNFGYKQFQRWKTFLESRVDVTGSIQDYQREIGIAQDNILFTDSDRIRGQWNSIGPNTGPTNNQLAELGIVTSLWVDPSNHNTIYAGSGTGGLFVSNDAGDHWNSLTDGYLITGVESIVKNDPSTIYIATGFFTWEREYSQGVLKSTNNGSSWQKTGLTSSFFGTQPFTVRGLVQDPNNSSVLWAIVNFEDWKGSHILKTSDAGATWSSVYYEPSNYNDRKEFQKIEINPLNPNQLIVTGNTIVISNDRGNT